MKSKTTKFCVGALALTILMTSTMIAAATEGKGVDAVSSATVKGAVQEKVIGLEAAKKAALKHGGLEAKVVTFTKAALETEDDGTSVYDVEFATATSRYEYEIGAVDGSVYEYSKKTIKKTSATKTTKPAVSTKSKSADVITADAAQNAALKHAGFTTAQVTSLRSKLDNEHGTLVYEVEFDNGDMEYEYELNAKTGVVLRWESEWD